MKNEQQIFEEWKRANKKGLNEGFLDGDEEKPVTSDDSTGEENLEELSNEDEKNSDLDISEEPEEGAEGEEGSDDESQSDDETPAEGEGKESIDNLEDFKGEGEEDDGAAKEAEAGVTTELKDLLSTLTTAIQTLSDKVENLGNNNNEEGSEEGEGEGESEEGASTEDFGDAELGDEDNGAEGEGESEEGTEGEGEEGGEGESEEGSEGEGESEEGSEGEGEEEDTSEDDSTKSEAYNYWHRKGRYLNAKSDYLIGKLNESRYDLLFEPIMTAINAKIRKRIEEAKKELREAALKK